jgi:hypothetical protein
MSIPLKAPVAAASSERPSSLSPAEIMDIACPYSRTVVRIQQHEPGENLRWNERNIYGHSRSCRN